MKRHLILAIIGLLASLTYAFPSDLMARVQVTDSSGNILLGTFNLTFNVSTTSDCLSVIHSTNAQRETDARGIINQTLSNIDIGTSEELYLCYYRDNVLKSKERILPSVYALLAQNVSWNGVFDKPDFSIYNDSGRIDSLNISKLDSLDQRFNDTLNIDNATIARTNKDNNFGVFDLFGDALGSVSSWWTTIWVKNTTTDRLNATTEGFIRGFPFNSTNELLFLFPTITSLNNNVSGLSLQVDIRINNNITNLTNQTKAWITNNITNSLNNASIIRNYNTTWVDNRVQNNSIVRNTNTSWIKLNQNYWNNTDSNISKLFAASIMSYSEIGTGNSILFAYANGTYFRNESAALGGGTSSVNINNTDVDLNKLYSEFKETGNTLLTFDEAQDYTKGNDAILTCSGDITVCTDLTAQEYPCNYFEGCIYGVCEGTLECSGYTQTQCQYVNMSGICTWGGGSGPFCESSPGLDCSTANEATCLSLSSGCQTNYAGGSCDDNAALDCSTMNQGECSTYSAGCTSNYAFSYCYDNNYCDTWDGYTQMDCED